MLAPTASPKQAKSRRQGPSGLTQALVREFLDYDSDTGFLTWRARNLSWFKCERDWKIWNTRYAGQRAGAWDSCYTRVSIFNKRYLTHRIIFLWMLSRWPNSQIDHIDHDPNNNRWNNLREVTLQENSKNLPLFRNNKSGHIGIYQNRNGSYSAEITVNVRKIHLGTFPTKHEAIAARIAAQQRYRFHENHGQAARALPRILESEVQA